MRATAWLLLVVLPCASSALAVSKGGTLYVAAKDTVLLKQPKAGAPKVAMLQPGAAVTWLGASDKDRQFHEVMAEGKRGFVLLSQLTPNQPQQEFDSVSGKALSPEALAASGPASPKEPFAPPSAAGAARNPGEQAAAAELSAVEALNQAKATPAAVAQKSKALQTP